MMPLDRWLAHELAPDIAHALGPLGPRAPRALRPDAIAQLVAEHRSGRKNHACGSGCC